MQDVDLNWVAMVDDPWNSALVGIFRVDRLRRDRLAVTAFFAGRPRAPWLINAGYQLAALVLMGALLGAWT